MGPNDCVDLETDVDSGTDTDTDTDTSEETNVGVDGATTIRISPSHKENRTGCDNKRPKSQVQVLHGRTECVELSRGPCGPRISHVQLAKQLCLTC